MIREIFRLLASLAMGVCWVDWQVQIESTAISYNVIALAQSIGSTDWIVIFLLLYIIMSMLLELKLFIIITLVQSFDNVFTAT